MTFFHVILPLQPFRAFSFLGGKSRDAPVAALQGLSFFGSKSRDATGAALQGLSFLTGKHFRLSQEKVEITKSACTSAVPKISVTADSERGQSYETIDTRDRISYSLSQTLCTLSVSCEMCSTPISICQFINFEHHHHPELSPSVCIKHKLRVVMPSGRPVIIFSWTLHVILLTCRSLKLVHYHLQLDSGPFRSHYLCVILPGWFIIMYMAVQVLMVKGQLLYPTPADIKTLKGGF